MGFELDKHDLFRNVVPGFIFLFVVFSFYFVEHDFILQSTDNITTFMSVMVITITLPIGYLIHNMYRAIHVIAEVRAWDRFEAERITRIDSRIVQVLDTGIADKDSERKREKKRVKAMAWLLEVYMHKKKHEKIKERGYTLISRVHSAGSAVIAVLGGVLMALAYFYLVKKGINLHWKKIWSCALLWGIVTVCLLIARSIAREGYEYMMRNYILTRREEVLAFIDNIIPSDGSGKNYTP